MVDIALIAGNFKPPIHVGHFELIKNASRENNFVKVFVSSCDRGGNDNEAKILHQDAEYIWTAYINHILPANVGIKFCDAPIKEIYRILGQANESMSLQDHYRIYTDVNDVDDYYPELSRQKYFGNLYKRGHATFFPILRKDTADISGTQMRQMIYYNMKNEFLRFLPEEIDGNAVWNMLYNRHYSFMHPSEREITYDFFGSLY